MFGMGSDWFAWLILILLVGGNGWGMGGFGMGGMMPWLMGMGGGMGAGFGLDYLYPWLNNSQHISDGFRDQQINSQLGDLLLGQAGIQQSICQTGNGITGAVRDGFYAAETAANGRQMASMQTAFGLQTQIAQGSADARLSACQTQNIIQAEGSATRASGNADTQKILDKLCQLELDGYKRDNDQLRAENSALKSQSFIAAEINQQNEIFYNRLKNCPVNAVPVAGNTPLFNCNPGFNSSCGCGSSGGNFR